MSMENLRDVILSDEYLDFILPYYDGIEQDFSEYGIQFFNSHLVMIHSRRPSENLINYLETDELRYTTLPKLYSLLDLMSLGILRHFNGTKPAFSSFKRTKCNCWLY